MEESHRMDEIHANRIVNELTNTEGLQPWFINRVLEILPMLHYNHSRRTIEENLDIILEVDQIMFHYHQFHPIACTWHDIGPEPYGGDFMAGCLGDSNDMFIVLMHPENSDDNIGIHVTDYYWEDKVGFELDAVSFEEDDYLTMDELIKAVDELIADWH